MAGAVKFLFILTHVEDAWATAPAGEAERVFEQYQRIESRLGARLLDSRRLRPSNEARTLHNQSGGRRALVEGPWSTDTATMGGYYLIECDSMDEALEWAKRMPNYGHGSIEVRPIWE